jgi:hypothetical protein
MEDLIFFIFSKFKFLFVIFDESKYKESHSQLYLTQIHSKISKNVLTSHILGTLFNFTFQFTSNAAHKIGKVAFFDQLTFIVHSRPFFHFTINTFLLVKFILELDYINFFFIFNFDFIIFYIYFNKYYIKQIIMFEINSKKIDFEKENTVIKRNINLDENLDCFVLISTDSANL